ncbi:MAG: hypothetical protein JWM10_3860, partial [Myxococcaceae bacterium]|nr:hypothetical protein [Myxococcaceae bacterium]
HPQSPVSRERWWLRPSGRGRRLRTLAVAPLRTRPASANVGGGSPPGEAGDCGRGRWLPSGRGRRLRAWAVTSLRARPSPAGVGGCSPPGEARDLRPGDSHSPTRSSRPSPRRRPVVREGPPFFRGPARPVPRDQIRLHTVSTPVIRRRARIFTLLARDYDVVQRYASFAFWAMPGGWEAYAPSLWSGRRQAAGGAETPVTEPVKKPS